jgi:hypothetical protein
MENDMAKFADRSWRARLIVCAWVACAIAIAVGLRVTPVNAQGTPQATDPPALSQAQLEQLVAPIALYPDDLLSQVLMASTYPLEVVQAARWANQNSSVTGKALEDAMAKQSWDPSVKGLVAVPQTLQMMSDKLDWTQQLGDAFLDDQAAVLDAVQRLRQRAEGAGNLKTSPQMKVSTVSMPNPSGQPVQKIVVERTDPQTVYVPVYDPAVAYGSWPYPQYPPYYYQPPGWVPGTFAYGALAFGTGMAVGAAIWGGANWGAGNVNINANRYNSFNRTNVSGGNWNHNGAHRGNVPYRNNAAAQKFGGQSAGNRAQAGQGNRQGAGAGNRQGAGKGAGNRQGAGAGNRQGGAGQKGAGNRQAGAGQKGGGNKGANRAGGGNKSANRASGGAARSGNAGRGGDGGGAHRAAGGGGGMHRSGGGGMHRSGGGGMHRGGGGMRAGGGGGRGGGGRGGGRRSDISVKHDIAYLGRLDNGLGFYRFSYNGSDKAYVGVMAQEVQFVWPDAVSRDAEGILRVNYDRLGVRFQTYDHWLHSGARVPASASVH